MKNNEENLGLMPDVKVNKKTSSKVSDQMEIVNSFKEMVESGSIEQFMIVGVDPEKQTIIATYCQDSFYGLGILEMGKFAFMNQQSE